jgi:AbiV family abortive infection protein
MAEPKFVSSRYLLEGAVYSLQQCGLLLRDAVFLYENHSYASSTVLAAFAREELGQWRILLDLRKKVIGGQHFTIDAIRDHCADHVNKQRAGMLSTTMRADRDTGLGKLLHASMKFIPGTQQWKTARAQIDEVDLQKRKRVPNDRHKQREAALYVDPISLGEWNRPLHQISKMAAYELLTDASNDYSIQYSQWYTHLEFSRHDDIELFNALEQWPDRPTLPPPERLSYPA